MTRVSAETAAKDFDGQLFRRLLALVRPYWPVALVALLALLAAALVDTAMINLLRRAVDESLAPVGRFAALSPEARYANLVRLALFSAFSGPRRSACATCKATCWRCSASRSCGTCAGRFLLSSSGSAWATSTATR